LFGGRIDKEKKKKARIVEKSASIKRKWSIPLQKDIQTQKRGRAKGKYEPGQERLELEKERIILTCGSTEKKSFLDMEGGGKSERMRRGKKEEQSRSVNRLVFLSTKRAAWKVAGGKG